MQDKDDDACWSSLMLQHRDAESVFNIPAGAWGPAGPVRPPGVPGAAAAAPAGLGPFIGVTNADPAAAAAAAWPAAAAAMLPGGAACFAVSRRP